MTLVTLEMGPLWKMELLRVVLEEHGVPGFVEDSNLKTIDPFLTGALALDARLKVPETALEQARAALAEARAGELDEQEVARAMEAELGVEEPAPPADPELEALARLGRRMRWAWVIPWMHPFLFAHGLGYVRELLRLRRAPPGNALTLLSLALATAFWVVVVFEVGEILRAALGPGQ